MGPVNTHNTIVKMPRIARIQNTEQQRDETQRRQFALALQEEAARKETQVQTSHKPGAAEIHRKAGSKKRRKRQRKRSRGENSAKASEQQNAGDGSNRSHTGQRHVDLKID